MSRAPAARRRARRRDRRPRGRARPARPARRASAAGRRRALELVGDRRPRRRTGRAPRGCPRTSLTDAPAHLVADDRRRRHRRADGRRRAGAHADRGRALDGQAGRHREQARHRPSRPGARGASPGGPARRCGSRPRSAAGSRSSGRSPPTSPRTGSTRVRGIVNGTTNFILTAMTDATAARLRRRRSPRPSAAGYAEADPIGRRRGARRGQQARDPRPARVRPLARSRVDRDPSRRPRRTGGRRHHRGQRGDHADEARRRVG